MLIDTDGGVDDAVAILIAVASPEIRLIGLTTVFGNVSVDQATDNALRLLALAGAEGVPVAVGADHPFTHPWSPRSGHPHGVNGLGGVRLPRSGQRAESVSAVELLSHLLHSSANPVTVCAIGPLTNIASLIATDPAAAARIERLVVLGGSYGSWGHQAEPEFNVGSDPEAAQQVFTSGLPVTVLGLNLTRSIELEAAALARIAASGRVGEAAATILAGRRDYGSGKRASTGVTVHDAVAVLEAITPGVLRTSDRTVTVHCGDGSERGTTRLGGQGATRPVRVAEWVDAGRAASEIETRLRSYQR